MIASNLTVHSRISSMKFGSFHIFALFVLCLILSANASERSDSKPTTSAAAEAKSDTVKSQTASTATAATNKKTDDKNDDKMDNKKADKDDDVGKKSGNASVSLAPSEYALILIGIGGFIALL